MLTQISSHKRAAVRFHFDNGNEVSVVWGGGTYSDNHDDLSETMPSDINKMILEDMAKDPNLRDNNPYMKNTGPFDVVSSNTVEIMVSGHEKFEAWFEKHYDSNPASYVSTEYVQLVLAHADSRKYMPKESKNG